MSAPLNTRPDVGRKVFYREPVTGEWVSAHVVRVGPTGLVDLRVWPPKTDSKVSRVKNGIKPGQWCGWSDDLWLPREGRELDR